MLSRLARARRGARALSSAAASVAPLRASATTRPASVLCMQRAGFLSDVFGKAKTAVAAAAAAAANATNAAAAATTPSATAASAPSSAAPADEAPEPAAPAYDPSGINTDDIFFRSSDPQSLDSPTTDEATAKMPADLVAEALRLSADVAAPSHRASRIFATSDVALGFSSPSKHPVRRQMSPEERAKWEDILARAKSASDKGNRALLRAIYDEVGVPMPNEDGSAPPSALDLENAGKPPMPKGFSFQTPVDPREGVPLALQTREMRDLGPLYKHINEQWNRSSPAAPSAAAAAASAAAAAAAAAQTGTTAEKVSVAPMRSPRLATMGGNAPNGRSGRLNQIELWSALVQLQAGSITPEGVLARYGLSQTTMGRARGGGGGLGAGAGGAGLGMGGGADEEDDAAAAMAEFESFTQKMDEGDLSPFYHSPIEYKKTASEKLPGFKTVAEAEAAEAKAKAGQNTEAASKAGETEGASAGFSPTSGFTAADRAARAADAAYRDHFVSKSQEFLSGALPLLDRLRFMRLLDIFALHQPALGRLMRGERIADEAHALERGLLRTIFQLVRAGEITEAEIDFFSSVMRRLMNHVSPGSSVPLADRVFYASNPEAVSASNESGEWGQVSELTKQHQERLRKFGVPEYARSASSAAPIPSLTPGSNFASSSSSSGPSSPAGGGMGMSASAAAAAAARMLPGSPYAVAAGAPVVAPTPYLISTLYSGALSAPLVAAASKDDPAIAATFAAFPANVVRHTHHYLRVPWLVESALEVQGTVRALHAVPDIDMVPEDRRGNVERLNFKNITRLSQDTGIAYQDAPETSSSTASGAEQEARKHQLSFSGAASAAASAASAAASSTAAALKARYAEDLARAARDTMSKVDEWSAPATAAAKAAEEAVMAKLKDIRERNASGAGSASGAKGEEVSAEEKARQAQRAAEEASVAAAEAEQIQEPQLYGGPRAVAAYLKRLEELRKEREAEGK